MRGKQVLASGCAAMLGLGAVALTGPAAGAAPGVGAAGTAGVETVNPAAAKVAATAREVEREIRGRGAAGSEWELNVEKEGERVDVDLDVESQAAGQRWDVRLYHDGKRVAKVVRVTDADGEFELDRLRPDTKGKDQIRIKATSSTGEVLTGKVRI